MTAWRKHGIYGFFKQVLRWQNQLMMFNFDNQALSSSRQSVIETQVEASSMASSASGLRLKVVTKCVINLLLSIIDTAISSGVELMTNINAVDSPLC